MRLSEDSMKSEGDIDSGDAEGDTAGGCGTFSSMDRCGCVEGDSGGSGRISATDTSAGMHTAIGSGSPKGAAWRDFEEFVDRREKRVVDGPVDRCTSPDIEDEPNPGLE